VISTIYARHVSDMNSDIPSLDLYGRHIPDPPPVLEASTSAPHSPGPPRRLSLGSRDGSSSSRSTSFNLPDSARSGIRAAREVMTDEVGEDEEMDEEGELSFTYSIYCL
jgi:protein phosphatase inhibitor 2